MDQNNRSSLFFVSLPKSGTVFTWYSLSGATGLAVPDFGALDGWGDYTTGRDFSCPTLYACGDYNTQLLRPENMAHFAEGYIFGAHMQASYHNLRILEEAGITEVSVLLRDPRDALVSWVHHLRKLGPSARDYHSKIYHLPDDYYDLDLADQFRFQVRSFLPVVANWVEGWLSYYASARRRIDMRIFLFDELKTDPRRYIKRLTDFHRVAEVDLSKVVEPEEGKMHFRKGMHGQWKVDFPAEDHDLVDALLGDRIVRGFAAAAESHKDLALARTALAEGRFHAAATQAVSALSDFPNHLPIFDLFAQAATGAGIDVTPVLPLADAVRGQSALADKFLYRYDLVDGCAGLLR